MLDTLLSASPAYDVRREGDGFVLIGRPDHLDVFSDLVRQAAQSAGDDFVVFPTSDGRHGYSEMFVLPLN